MNCLVHKLRGGDRRSIGNSNAVVGKVLRNPARFAEIIDGLTHDDPLVRMRCADVAEKVSLRHPDWLQPHSGRLLTLAARSQEQEVRWHLAQMLPRLDLTRTRRRQAETILLGYLDDESRIVKTFAMQALADFAIKDLAFRRRLLPLLGRLGKSGSPAMRARARKLLASLSNYNNPPNRRSA